MATPRAPRERDRLIQALTFLGAVLFVATAWAMCMACLLAQRMPQ